MPALLREKKYEEHKWTDRERPSTVSRHVWVQILRQVNRGETEAEVARRKSAQTQPAQA